MKISPPKRALNFLRWFCREDYIEEIEGDLTEIFENEFKDSPSKANRKFFWRVIRYFRPEFIKSFKPNYQPNSIAMVKNYFKISWRSLNKQRMYSSIKIGGFALGIAACLLITLFIKDELSFDKHFTDGDRIYRVIGVFNDGGDLNKDVWFPAPFAGALMEDYGEVEKAGRLNPVPLFGAGSNELRRIDAEDNSYEEGFTYADQEFLEVLQIPMAYGSRNKALSEPNTIVISKRKAEKYYPNENPLGKVLVINNEENKPYTITAVMENFPSTSHLQYDFLVTLKDANFYPGEETNWGASNYPTYIKISATTNVKELEGKMTKGVMEKYIKPRLLEQGVPNAEEILKNASLEFQPIKDIHLYSQGISDNNTHGDIRFVWLFGAIAAFILIIACVNFINLATARSANRAKEVGLRKTIGSLKSHLVKQFLTESVLLSFISVILGVLLAVLVLPYFNNVTLKSLSIPWTAWWLAPFIGGVIIVLGVIAGIYPAFYLSSFKPIQVLKGNISRGSKNSFTRSMLVVFQFTISIILIAGTLVIYRQMEFIMNAKIGFDKEQVLLLKGANTLNEKVLTLKEELKKLPSVASVSISDYLPVEGSKRNGNTFWKEGMTKTEKGVGGQRWRVDHDYIKTLGMNIVEGRDFSAEMLTDSSAVIINEAMVKELGLTEPIGQKITNGGATWTIIGVVENFHFQTMKESIRPVCLNLASSPDIISVKITGSDVPSTLKSVTELWNRFSPHQPIRYSFLDENYEHMYADVQRSGQIFSSFSILAIVVACLGLFGLSAFMVEQRGKEISIRIVLGASFNSIVNLLTKNFMLLILISIVIATPIAWFAMKRWLEDFVYRIDVGWDVFLISGGAAILVAIITVGYQSIRAAIMNPVNNLRSE